MLKPDVQDNILHSLERGEEVKNIFIKERINGDKNMWDKLCHGIHQPKQFRSNKDWKSKL